MKVERVSYDVITPSAARAIFEAILWKPAIAWHVTRVEVLNPIRWMTLRRNEVGSVVPIGNVKEAMTSGTGRLALYVEEDRQQRAGLLLRDVRYRLHAQLDLTPRAAPGETIQKFQEMFRRRAEKGQCFTQPYLGCREFSCAFRYVDGVGQEPRAEPITRELGLVLYDLDFTDASHPKPRFFSAALRSGVLDVPPWGSAEVLA